MKLGMGRWVESSCACRDYTSSSRWDNTHHSQGRWPLRNEQNYTVERRMMRFLSCPIWGFPEIGVPPNHPFLDGIFPYNSSSYWGTPFMETPIWMIHCITTSTQLSANNQRCQRNIPCRWGIFHCHLSFSVGVPKTDTGFFPRITFFHARFTRRFWPVMGELRQKIKCLEISAVQKQNELSSVQNISKPPVCLRTAFPLMDCENLR